MIESVERTAYGRPASLALARTVAAAQAGGPLVPVTVIVPSNVAGLVARRLLGSGRLGGAGLANVSFITPLRLAQLLGAPSLAEGRPLTNPVLGAAVRAVLAADPGPFTDVADHHATVGAVSGLYAALSSLSRRSLTLLERVDSSGARLAVRLHRDIGRRLAEFHGEAEMAAAAAGRADLAGALAPFGTFVWYLPGPITAPLAALLAVVARTAPFRVLVGASGDPGADAAVSALCARVGVDTAAAVPAGVAVAAPTAAGIISVTDADEEVRAVVRTVVELASGASGEAPVPLERIGVFYPVSDPYVRILTEQFEAAGLPCNGPSRRRLTDSVAGRVVLGALGLPADNWRRDRVMALVAGGPLRHGGTRVRPAAWEDLSRAAGVVGGLDDWSAKLARHRGHLQDLLRTEGSEHRRRRAGDDLADLDALEEFVGSLADHVIAVERASGWGERGAAVERLLTDLLGAGNTRNSWPEAEQAAFEQVAEALARLAALDEIEPTVLPHVFVEALRAELDRPGARTGRFGIGVTFGPLSSAVGHDLDAVFVLGAIEGWCPVARRDDALLPDSLRQLTHGELLTRAAHVDEQHRWWLAALASAPPSHRFLTFARGDLRGGGTALPSRWLLDTASALAGHIVHATEFDRLGPEAVRVVHSHADGLSRTATHASLTERDVAEVHRFVLEGHDPGEHPVLRELERGVGAQSARRSDQFTEWDGNLAGTSVPPPGGRVLSASRLEAWAGCGYRYFLAHVLGLGERDDPERIIDLSALDQGSGVHSVLEEFIAEVIAAGAPAPGEQWTAAHRSRLVELATARLDELERQGRTGRPLLWRTRRAEILSTLLAFLDHEAAHRAGHGVTPVHVESAFGMDGVEPLSIRLPDGRELSFRGIVDRLDEGPGGRWVVSDYKTGRGSKYQKLLQDPVNGGTTLQLGLYAELARQRFGAEHVHSQYWMVDTAAGFATHGYEWTEERRQRFLDVLAAIADGIDAGVFAKEPGEWDIFRNTHEHCTYCDFDAVCDRGRGEQAAAIAGRVELTIRRRLAPAEDPT